VNAKFNTGQTPLMTAVWKGHLEITKFLIESGADPKVAVSSGTTALLIACESQRDDLVEELLKAGAPITAALEDGGNALLLSCVDSPKATRIVKLILDHPDGKQLVRSIRNIKRGPKNVTALHICAENNCRTI